MRRVPLVLLAAGVVAVLVGCAVLTFTVTDYLGHPMAISSTSGRSVFEGPGGGLVSYDYFQAGPGVNIITAGGMLMFASLFLLAVLWRGKRVSDRRSLFRIR